jgi:hypothetical protein
MKTNTLALFSLILCVSTAYGYEDDYGYEDYSYGDYRSELHAEHQDYFDGMDSNREFLGNISANTRDFNSLSNPFRFDSNERQIDSPLNPYNIDGGASPYEIDGWNNPRALDSGVPVFK